jgi:6-pyruvoyl-tetrahydropterin synthase
MTKINIYIPEPQDPYTVNNFRQINQTLETLQNQLNTSYLNEIKNEQIQFEWFIS